MEVYQFLRCYTYLWLPVYKHVLIADHSEHKEAEKVAYPHLNIRKEEFPWGEESLFTLKKREHTPQQENFITVWIRKLQDDHVKEDWKIQVEVMQDAHQQMMEHIEKKKFPQYPALSAYGRIFGYPMFDPQSLGKISHSGVPSKNDTVILITQDLFIPG